MSEENRLLLNYQEVFLKSVLGEEIDQTLSKNIIPIGSLSVDDVFQVYRSDYYARLTEALGENFEAVWAVVGDEVFFSLAEKYIKAYPSDYRDLTFYGEFFPEFLKEESVCKDYPFLDSLASFEIEFWKCFHQEKLLTNFDITQLGQEELMEGVISFSENVSFLSWNYSLLDIWKLRTVGFEEFDGDVNKAQNIVMFKNSQSVSIFELSKEQMKLALCLKNGHTLNDSLHMVEIEAVDLQKLFEVFGQFGVLALVKAAS